MVSTWMLYGYTVWFPYGYHMAGIWFIHMEYIWALGCKPHLYPYASHMTSHMVYIWVTYDNAIGAMVQPDLHLLPDLCVPKYPPAL